MPVKRTLDTLRIPRATFIDGATSINAVDQRCSPIASQSPKRVWNRIPDVVREKIIALALDAR
jgi:putative transposase